MSEATKTADVSKGKLMVEAIANGTVIDHIAPGQAMNIQLSWQTQSYYSRI